jgi:sugar lactone lactonase YvrE
MINMSISAFELVVDAKAVIGESPLWCEDQGALYWIDVKAPALYCTDVATLETTSWCLNDIGGYALKSNAAGALLGLRTGIFTLDFATGELSKICDAPVNPLTHRFNEGDCDPRGRLWLGTMFDPKAPAHSPPTRGKLYSFTSDAGLIAHDNLSLLHNGFAWDRNGREFLLAHSREGRIYAFEFNVERGELGRNRIFAEIPKALGVPDGGAFRRARLLLERNTWRRVPPQIRAGRAIGSGRRTSGPESDHDGLWRTGLARSLRYQRNTRQAG